MISGFNQTVNTPLQESEQSFEQILSVTICHTLEHIHLEDQYHFNGGENESNLESAPAEIAESFLSVNFFRPPEGNSYTGLLRYLPQSKRPRCPSLCIGKEKAKKAAARCSCPDNRTWSSLFRSRY